MLASLFMLYDISAVRTGTILGSQKLFYNIILILDP